MCPQIRDSRGGEKAGAEVRIYQDSVEFEIMPPAQSVNAMSLTSDIVSEALPAPIAPPMPGQPARIQLRCKAPVSSASESVSSEEELPASTSRFRIGLESTQSNEVGYESVSFDYECGSSGAIVSILGLSAGSSYVVDAQYWSQDVVTHQGKTESFGISRDGNASVRLVMVHVKPPQRGRARVDVVFDDQPGLCGSPDIGCAKIYAPVRCSGTASPTDGRAIAMIIGPIKAGNRCEAKQLLNQEACLRKATLINMESEPLQ